MAQKKIDFDKYAAGLFTRTELYADRVRRHYATAVDELLKLTAGGDLGASGAFSFGDNTKLSEKANSILRGLYSAVYGEIQNGVQAEWEYANLSCDALIESIFGKGLNESNHFARWFSRNKDAMDSFFRRKSAYGGLNLSQKVWKYTGDLKTEMECALTLSLGQGDSAATVSRRVRQYLQEPDKMFRRFRVKTGEKKIYDEEGNVIGTEPIYGRRWKRKVIDPQTGAVTWENFNPRNYHPGRGVYRSSYKNAMRLTRTETNMAYRTAEQDRWQRMDFVVGYEIKLSNNHPIPDICNDLKGKYPKDFVFKGWHPQCRCYCIPILASQEEFVKMEKAILDGKEPPSPHGIIRKPPKGLRDWWRENQERVESATSIPYWVADNHDYIYTGRSKTTREDILRRWEERAKKAKVYTRWTMTADDIDKKNGNIGNIIATGVDADLYNSSPMAGIDLINLDKNIREIAKKAGININYCRLNIGRSGATIDWGALNNGQEFQMSRMFKREADGSITVEHSFFELGEEFQGKGLSKEMFRELYRHYRGIGVSKIEVHANIDRGGYTWAKYGFYANNAEQAYQSLAAAEMIHHRSLDAAYKIIDEFYDFEPRTEPFPMYKLAALPDGKGLLYEADWCGFINLKDAEQRAIFEAYIGL